MIGARDADVLIAQGLEVDGHIWGQIGLYALVPMIVDASGGCPLSPLAALLTNEACHRSSMQAGPIRPVGFYVIRQSTLGKNVGLVSKSGSAAAIISKLVKDAEASIGGGPAAPK